MIPALRLDFTPKRFSTPNCLVRVFSVQHSKKIGRPVALAPKRYFNVVDDFKWDPFIVGMKTGAKEVAAGSKMD